MRISGNHGVEVRVVQRLHPLVNAARQLLGEYQRAGQVVRYDLQHGVLLDLVAVGDFERVVGRRNILYRSLTRGPAAKPLPGAKPVVVSAS